MPLRCPRRPPRSIRRRAAGLAACAALLVPVAGCGSLSRDDNARGVALYQQGNYRGAVSHFQRALARQPGSPDCFYNLGATYHQQAKVYGQPTDFRSAEQYYHLCLARHPDHDACRRALANLLVEQRRSPEAVALLEDWSRGRPDDPNPRIELARLSVDHGDLAGAEAHLVGALAIDPGNARALGALEEIRGGAAGSGGLPAAATPAGTVMLAAHAGSLADASPGGIVRTVASPASPPPMSAAAATSGLPPTPSAPPPAASAFPAR